MRSTEDEPILLRRSLTDWKGLLELLRSIIAPVVVFGVVSVVGDRARVFVCMIVGSSPPSSTDLRCLLSWLILAFVFVMVVAAAVGAPDVTNGVFGTYFISPSTRSPSSGDEVVVVTEGVEVVVVEEEGEGSLAWVEE